jgi:hypothetical protein
VRSVVSAWRETAGRLLAGTQIFNLLLHATQHGTFEAIPDLSLRSDLFEAAATEAMCRWARNLVSLSKEEIDAFVFLKDASSVGASFRWKDSKLEPFERSEAFEQEELSGHRVRPRRMQPALTVDSRKMRSSSVTVEQKIKLSGSLKAPKPRSLTPA